MGKYRKMERESELCIYVGVVKKKAVIGDDDGKIIPKTLSSLISFLVIKTSSVKRLD